jgi:hypothetical protein
MATKEQIKKATKWLKGAGIEYYTSDGRVFVWVSGEELEISQEEIKFRAELQDKDND